MMKRTNVVLEIQLELMETRPLSKNKKWRLVEIIEKAK